MMNGELRPYEEYEKIELPWLSEIPRGWTIKRGKQLFKMVDERTSTGGEELLSVSASYGVVKRKNTNVTMFKAASYVGYKLCWEKDLVVNSLWAWQQGLGFSKYHGIISTAYSVYRLRSEKENSKYFDYLLRSDSYLWELRTRSKGIWKSRYQLHDSSFMDMPFIIPPRPEQDQIVKYLDHKLAKINKFIKAKKKLIAALKEQKQAIINQAVTKGLDSKVRMKPSGIEWLGDIPEHWDIFYLRNLLKATSKKNGDHLPLLSVVREKGVILRSEMTKEENHNFIPDDLSGYKVVRAGQFVMNKMKAWQGSYGVSNHDGIVSPAYYIFEVLFSNKEYFHYAIRSKFYVNFFAQASDGIRIGQWDLSLAKMKAIPFLVPPDEEQKRIIRYIQKTFLSIDESIEKLDKEIGLMTEYKVRLVSDVVTGKVDVRGSIADLLEEIDLSDPEFEEDTTDEEVLDIEDGDE